MKYLSEIVSFIFLVTTAFPLTNAYAVPNVPTNLPYETSEDTNYITTPYSYRQIVISPNSVQKILPKGEDYHQLLMYWSEKFTKELIAVSSNSSANRGNIYIRPVSGWGAASLIGMGGGMVTIVSGLLISARRSYENLGEGIAFGGLLTFACGLITSAVNSSIQESTYDSIHLKAYVPNPSNPKEPILKMEVVFDYLNKDDFELISAMLEHYKIQIPNPENHKGENFIGTF